MALPVEETSATPASPGYNVGVKFTLRDFRPEDFEILWRIDQKCFVPSVAYSRVELSTYIRRRGAFTLVAEVLDPAEGPAQGPPAAANGRPKIIGFIVAEHARGGTGHIISIDVLPADRRSGVGSKLLAAAEEKLRSIACRRIELEAAIDNTSALAFYKRQGYDAMKILPRYYSNGVDALVLEKELAPQPAMKVHK